MTRISIDAATQILGSTSITEAIKALHYENALIAGGCGIHIDDSRYKISVSLDPVMDLFQAKLPSVTVFNEIVNESNKDEITIRDWPIKNWCGLLPETKVRADKYFRNSQSFGAESSRDFAEAVKIIADERRFEEVDWVYSDGGLRQAPKWIQEDTSIGGEYEGRHRHDCGVRSLAIGLELPYETVWKFFHNTRKETQINTIGVTLVEYCVFLHHNGWAMNTSTFHPEVTVGDIIRRLNFAGWTTPYVISCHGHLTAVKNGKIHDITNPITGKPITIGVPRKLEKKLERILGLLIDNPEFARPKIWEDRSLADSIKKSKDTYLKIIASSATKKAIEKIYGAILKLETMLIKADLDDEETIDVIWELDKAARHRRYEITAPKK